MGYMTTRDYDYLSLKCVYVLTTTVLPKNVYPVKAGPSQVPYLKKKIFLFGKHAKYIV